MESDGLLRHSSSRASFNALIDEVMPRAGERDVSFLYKSLMRGAVLDVEAAEATCNDAILIHNHQNNRKGASQENILGAQSEEPFVRSSASKPAAAQGQYNCLDMKIMNNFMKNNLQKNKQTIIY